MTTLFCFSVSCFTCVLLWFKLFCLLPTILIIDIYIHLVPMMSWVGVPCAWLFKPIRSECLKFPYNLISWRIMGYLNKLCDDLLNWVCTLDFHSRLTYSTLKHSAMFLYHFILYPITSIFVTADSSGNLLFVMQFPYVLLRRSYGNIQKLAGGPYSRMYSGRWWIRCIMYTCQYEKRKIVS